VEVYYSMEIIYSHEKIETFINSLDESTARRVFRLISRLEELGHKIRMPYSKNIESNLFELRLLGRVQVRIIYTYHDDHAVLLNIFIKKFWRIPRGEIEYAKEVLKRYIA